MAAWRTPSAAAAPPVWRPDAAAAGIVNHEGMQASAPLPAELVRSGWVVQRMMVGVEHTRIRLCDCRREGEVKKEVDIDRQIETERDTHRTHEGEVEDVRIRVQYLRLQKRRRDLGTAREICTDVRRV